MKSKISKPTKIALAVLVSLNLTIMVYAEGIGYGANNGGNSGTSVTVTTASELANYASSSSAYNITVSGTIDLGTDGSIDVGSNTTIQGENSSSTILGTITIDGVSNVIIKYLNISAPTGDPGDNDGVQVRGGSSGILITKCNIYDCTDGNLDITHGGGTTTVSWCKFYYTRDNGHNFSNLIGASDDDNGDYRTTWHHNWWAEGCQQRMTATRFGPCHMFNNYWSSTGNDYCTTSRNVCEMRSENNYYDNVEDPLNKEQSGTLWTSGNIFNNCTGEQDVSSDNVFSPPYSYSLDATNDVPGIVMAGAGNVGSSGGGSGGGGGNNGSINGTYSIVASHSGKAMDTYNWGTSNGTNIVQWNFWGGDAQQYNISQVDGDWHRITPVIASGQAIDVAGISTADGANIQTWSYWGGDGQQFRFQSAGTGVWRIIARHSGKCLDVDGASSADGANIIQWTCISGASNQMFELINQNSAQADISNAKGSFELYPNPADNVLNINIPQNLEIQVQVSIVNHVGQRVMEISQMTNGVNTIDISNLEAGLYMAEISYGSETRVKKFTKH